MLYVLLSLVFWTTFAFDNIEKLQNLEKFKLENLGKLQKLLNVGTIQNIQNVQKLEAEKDPDVGKDMIEIVAEKGYPIEEYYVTTEDGYILGLFRIPYGRLETEASHNIGKPVVFLQHGLLDSSYTWVNNFPNESLGFLLADAGYDVWLGNNRGNTFSKRHVHYKTHSDQFWNFSYDEMARYDQPSMIDFVLNYTNKTSLAYAGHSEGTTVMFAAPSFNEKIVDKVAIYGALAGIAYMKHSKSIPLDLLAYLDVDLIFELFGIRQFLPGIYFINYIGPDICATIPQGCDDFLFLICGPTENLNATRIQVYVSETPADTSVKNMAHWSQAIKTDNFQMYDYGSKEKNEEIYGKNYPDPPLYDLSKVTMPTVLYTGTNDYLADPTDADKLAENLPNLLDHIIIDGYAHLDFVWGYNANVKVYQSLMQYFEKYIGPGKVKK